VEYCASDSFSEVQCITNFVLYCIGKPMVLFAMTLSDLFKVISRSSFLIWNNVAASRGLLAIAKFLLLIEKIAKTAWVRPI